MSTDSLDSPATAVVPALALAGGAVDSLPWATAGSAGPAPPPAAWPAVGDTFLDFTLVEELGRGAFARVFLAYQHGLADRPVALKLTLGADTEAESLARLQHAHVVPIYSVHDGGPVRAVCMPFFGRATLADLSRSVAALARVPASGEHVVSTLQARQSTHRSAAAPAAAPAARPQPCPTLDRLRHLAYPDAVLLLGRQIADGLAHAHERGIVHRDLKPANVLLTDDGRPMILDFNLAADAAAGPGRRGGTLPYMAPEQLEAMAGRPAVIDHRADVFALGVLLYELLTGRPAYPVAGNRESDLLPAMIVARTRRVRPARSLNRAVTPAVDAILGKCLAHDPAARYQSAADLIEDLDRHRADLPLRHAGNPSLTERAGKLVRRNPKLVAPPVLFAAGLCGVLAAAVGAEWSAAAADRRAAVARAEDGGRRVDAFDHLAGTAEQYLTAHNGHPELLARGRRAADEAVSVLAGGAADDWAADPAFVHLPAADRDRLAARVADLTALRTTTPGDLPATGGRLAAVAAAQAAGKFRDTVPELQAHTAARPDDVTGWFLLGRAHAELGAADEAYLAYSTAVALRPRFAPGYFHRAVVADRLRKADPAGRRPQALTDADAAVRLAPDFAEARLLRAQVLVQLKRHADARVDLDAVLAGPTAPTRAWLLRSAVRAAVGDAAGAAADKAEGLRREPDSAYDYVARGAARRSADPAAALADYAAAERLAPGAALPLEHAAYLQAEVLNRPADAADTLARLLARQPNVPLVAVSRAVYLARAGQMKAAVAAVEQVAAANPPPAVRYRVGCVYALAAAADPAHAPTAVRHLAAALKAGYGYEHLPTDPDLAAVRPRPDFRAVAAAAGVLTNPLPTRRPSEQLPHPRSK